MNSMIAFKKSTISYTLCLATFCLVYVTGNAQKNWNKEQIVERAQNQNNPQKWNMKMFEEDKKSMDNIRRPLLDGVFPVAKYNTPGTGYTYVQLPINGIQVEGIATFVRKGEFNEANFPDSIYKNQVNLILLVLDGKNKNNLVSSRNHPYYLAGGTLKTKARKVEWLTIKSPDNASFAVVNMKLFDLRAGIVVLIAPQKDKTFRAYQLEAPFLSAERLTDYLKELANNKEVIDFFKQ